MYDDGYVWFCFRVDAGYQRTNNFNIYLNGVRLEWQTEAPTQLSAPAAAGGMRLQSVSRNAEENEGLPIYFRVAADETKQITVEGIEKKPATIYSASVVFNGLIQMKYYYILPDYVTEDPGAYLRFTKNGEEVHRIPVSEAEVNNGYTMFYYNVVAKETSDVVTAQLIDGNGEPIRTVSGGGVDYTAGVPLSVMEYAERIPEVYPDDEKVIRLAHALEDYGKAAQIWFKYADYSGLTVSDEVQAVTLDDLADYAHVKDGNLPSGITGGNMTVVFEADNSLRIYYSYDGSKEAGAYSYTIDSNTGAALKQREDGQYYLEVPNVAAKALGNAHSFVVSDGTDSYTVQASALSYARLCIQVQNNPALNNLGKALYRYCMAAKDYFGS